jgi:hypothetical protein
VPRLPMLPRLRTVALLMLAAGLSLGVFAAKAISTWHLPIGGDETPARVSPIEERVRFYQRAYDLDGSGADLVRRELVRYDRHVMDKLWELRKQNEAWFQWAADGAQRRLTYILEKRMIPAGGYGLEPASEPKPGANAKDDGTKKDDETKKDTREDGSR